MSFKLCLNCFRGIIGTHSSFYARMVEVLLAQVDRKDDELEALKARLDALVANIEHHPDDLREIDRLLAV